MRSHPSPNAEGFRALVSAPGAFVAELVWRWLFGVAAVVIAAWSLNRFLHAIVISAAQEAALASGVPYLVWSAMGRIAEQMPQAVLRISAVLLPGISLLWVFAATAGRTTSVQRLLEFFAQRYGVELPEVRVRSWSLMMLHFLRVVIGVAALAGYLGALVIAEHAARVGETPSIGVFLLVLLPLEFVIVMIASWLNWVVALAPIFVVRDGLDWLSALGIGIVLSRTRAGSFSGVATWLGLSRIVIAVVFGFVGLTAISLFSSVSGWAVLIALALIYLVYSIFSDALLTARLAAYVAIAQQEIVPEPVPPTPAVPTPSWLRPLPLALPPAEA